MNSKERYAEYLKSTHWAFLRAKKLKAVPGCESCESTANLHVHHRNYRKWYDCTPDDLMAFCETCHFRLHTVLAEHGLKPRLCSEISSRMIAGCDIDDETGRDVATVIAGWEVDFSKLEQPKSYPSWDEIRDFMISNLPGATDADVDSIDFGFRWNRMRRKGTKGELITDWRAYILEVAPNQIERRKLREFRKQQQPTKN